MSYRLSSETEAWLDGIWLYIARESGSVDTAIRSLQNISDRFWLLAKLLGYPHWNAIVLGP